MSCGTSIYSGILFSDKKKWGLKLQKSRDESQIHIAKGKKPVWKGYVMVPIIWNSGKGKNRDSEKIRGCQGSRGGEEDKMGGAQGVFREVNPNCKTRQWCMCGTIHLSWPTELYSEEWTLMYGAKKNHLGSYEKSQDGFRMWQNKPYYKYMQKFAEGVRMSVDLSNVGNEWDL